MKLLLSLSTVVIRHTFRANCPLLTLSKWQCDESCYSRTNDSASRSHQCSFKVSMFPFPPFDSFLFLSLTTPHHFHCASPFNLFMLLFFFHIFCLFPFFDLSYLLLISLSSLLFLLMLWVKHASQSLVGRTVSTVHGNL